MPYLDIPHGTLYYETSGTGPPLVLIHGSGANARIWEPQTAFFEERHQVVRYDLRGHGRSTVPTGAPYTHSGDLVALLDHLGIETAVIAGQSMGGGIAMSVASNYPERVTRLILVDTILDGYEWLPGWNESWTDIVEAATRGDRDAMVRAVLDHPLLEVSVKNPEVRARLARIFADYSGWSFANADPLVPDDPPSAKRLHEIIVPVLLITGDSTTPDFLRIADILAAGVPNIRRVDLPGVGHVSPLEAPEQFNALVAEFLA